jgi:hypothetical protein
MSRTPQAHRLLQNRTSAKKAYIRPRLVEYGSLAKLTQAKTGISGDGGSSKKML